MCTKYCCYFFQVNENCLKAFILQGKAYVGLKEYEKAIDSYTDAVKAAPDKEAMINSKVQILFVLLLPFFLSYVHGVTACWCEMHPVGIHPILVLIIIDCTVHHLPLDLPCCIMPEESQEQMQEKQSDQEMERTSSYRQTNLVLCS